jgi:catechol 2,3-dioxygenase-like lactoylglutathione lyase family enzyme
LSYVAIATNSFEEVSNFYHRALGFEMIDEWEREHGRGRRFNAGGMVLEILDNMRERNPMRLFRPGDRFHLVVEVPDIEAAHRGVAVSAPKPRSTSWVAILFEVRDPDGVPVTFLQWYQPKGGTRCNESLLEFPVRPARLTASDCFRSSAAPQMSKHT